MNDFDAGNFSESSCAHTEVAQHTAAPIKQTRSNSLSLASLPRYVFFADFRCAFKSCMRFQKVKFTSPVGPLRCLAMSKFTGSPSD